MSIKYQLLTIGLLACNIARTQTWVLEKELTLKDSSYHWTSDEFGFSKTKITYPSKKRIKILEKLLLYSLLMACAPLFTVKINNYLGS